jgi:hypothetical protein
MTAIALESILDKHSIPQSERPVWRALVERGERPESGMLRRVKGSPCLHDILEALSEPFLGYYRRAGL